MRNLRLAVILSGILGVGLMGGGCSHNGGGSVTAPSVGASTVTSGTSARTKDVVYTGVAWGSTVGQVTVTAQQSGTYTFIVWNANDYDNQVMVAASNPAYINEGASALLSVGFAESCGTRYQADVYLNLPKQETYTLSDVANYLYAARGAFSTTVDCERVTPPTTPPVIVPPVVVVPPVEPPVVVPPVVPPVTPPVEPPPPVVLLCADQTAQNYGGPLPCIYAPPPPPPPPVVGCVAPSIEGGPFDISSPNGAGARLLVAQGYVAGVVADGNAGGSFGGNNAIGTFIPNQNYAVVIFHKGGDARVYTGLVAGNTYPLVWGKNGVSAFAFNCAVQ